MITKLVKIGNSQGIRIPKPFLSQCNQAGELELVVRGHELVLHKPRRHRQGWKEAFRQMARQGDDKLLDADASALSSWDETEWKWE